MNYISFLLSCFLLSTSLTYAQEEKIWSLKDCIDYAIEHNIQVQQLELSIEDAELNIKDAKGAFLPDLNGTARNTWVNSLAIANNGNPLITNAFLEIQQDLFEIRRAVGLDVPTPDISTPNQQATANNSSERVTNRNFNVNLNSTITIFNGLRNKYNLQQAKLQKIANTYNNDRLKDDIRLQIANTYLQVLLAKANVKVLNAQNEITLQQIERTNILIESGILPRGDILELEATSAREKQQIVATENDYLVALLSLKRALNLNLLEPIDIVEVSVENLETQLLALTANQLVSEVLKNRNEIKLAEQNLLIADKSIKIARGNFLPTLNGFVGLSSFESDINPENVTNEIKDNFQYNYGLNLTVPIFNRTLTKNSIDRAEVNKMRTQYDLDLVKQRLTQQVYQAYLDAKAGKKSFEAAEAANNAQQTAFEYAENRFKAGVSNSFEFNQVKLRLQNSEIDLVTAKYDYLFRLKLLELYYTGKITEQ